jgi:peptide-methionine (S)-S-oxide reductase
MQALPVILLIGLVFVNCTKSSQNHKLVEANTQYDTATLGSGCFWCSEAIYNEVNGVVSVSPGYSGGKIKNPTYREVCTGETGYAEVCQLVYNPKIVSFEELLEIFWQIHNPTTLNRQGADVGTQYRSVIFYHNQQQKELAEIYKHKLDSSGVFDEPIVTAIEAFRTFYPAEDYHKNYYNNNRQQAYCQIVIKPKIEKFRKVFHDKLR